MSVPLRSLFVGILRVTMLLAGTLLARLPMCSAMIYLAAGLALGPEDLAVITPDPMRHAPALELAAEVAVLIWLFSVGLRMGFPLRDRRWWLPVRLAFVSSARARIPNASHHERCSVRYRTDRHAVRG